MDIQTIKNQTRTFILENFLFDQDTVSLSDNDSFIEEQIIDSTGVLELVLFVEETYGFSVEDNEVIPENFDSVGRLAAYVGSKLAVLSLDK